MASAPPDALHPRQIRTALRLSRERFARLFDVSSRTIERWEEKDCPPANALLRRRMYELSEVACLANAVYTPAGVELFLTSPTPVFDGRTALQLIEDGRAEQVIGALATDYEGAFT